MIPISVISSLGPTVHALVTVVDSPAPLVQWAAWVGHAAVGVSVLVILWAVRLHRIIRQRTADLEAKNLELERESSERRHALDAARLADQRLRMAMEAAEMRSWHWDVITDRFELLGAWPAGLGPRVAPMGSPMREFLKPVHADDLPMVREALDAAVSGTTPLSARFRVVLPDGSTRWKVTRGSSVRDGNGRVTAVVGVVLDVTDRARQEEELRLSEERYRELFENANDIIYTHDLAGNFTSINNAAERLLGRSRDQVLRLSVADVVAPEQIDLARGMIARKVAGDVSRTEYELDVLANDGRRVTLEVNTRLIHRDGVVTGVQGIARDVTERKRLEAQLRQSQKMEAVGQLAGGIAHDFNNLLTAVLGNAQLARLGLPVGSEVHENLADIEGAAHRAAALTRQLLVFSRQQRIDRRPVQLADTLGAFTQMLRRIIGEDLDLRLTVAPDVSPVLADPVQLEQVVLNLAVNARDAMPDGGRLDIELDETTIGAAHCAAHAGARPGRYVRLRISDTGRGIPPDARQRIFEPFFTTKDVGEGTGLGLAVVYGIVRQHDGFIDVTTAPGKGTRFAIHLPADAGPVAAAPTEPRPPAPGGRETILVAEDEESLCRLTERLLVGLGYSVLIAHDGQEALEQFAAHGDRIDLLLLDVVMPRKGGRDVHAAVRSMGSAVPIMFMTGYSADVAPNALAAETGCRILYKPYDLDALAHVVREAMDGAELVA